jgi:hypothetical protein
VPRFAQTDNNSPDVVGRGQQADAADGVLLRTLRHIAAASVGVAAAQRIQQVLEGELVGAQLVEIGLHLVLLDEAAHGHHVGHARHLAQGAFDHPVLQGAQLGGGLPVAAQTVAHDFTHRRGVGGNVGLHARQANQRRAAVHSPVRRTCSTSALSS